MSGGSTRALDRDAQRTRLAVAALLVPPVAWALSLALSYAIQDFTCSAYGSVAEPPPEGAIFAVLTVLNAVLFLVTVLAGIAGFVVARRIGRGRRSPLVFLGYVGAGLAVVFGFGIVLIAWPQFVVEVCG
ncbi:hypothetical protein GCM10027280_35690 [Micromonospora polyrhachis]